MPELPEVETVRRGLEPVLKGARLSEVTLFRDGLRKPFSPGMKSGLEGAIVSHLTRRAKYLRIHLEDGHDWVIHLGMTGRFQIEDIPQPAYYHHNRPEGRHRHLSLTAALNGSSARIDYYDPRRFGQMWWLKPGHIEAQTWWSSLGIEPLSDDLNGKVLKRLFDGRAAPLKTLMMRQDLIAGLGNIYVCEALFAAGLSPDRSGLGLTNTEAERLAVSIRKTLTAALAAGGSSISDFAAASGELGYFQHSFAVYDRLGQACVKPGCKGVIAREVHAGRSTFFCPKCQG